MSPKMSSLAVEEMEEQGLGKQFVSFEPELHLITPRHSRNQSSIQTHPQDVIVVKGCFTVSF